MSETSGVAKAAVVSISKQAFTPAPPPPHIKKIHVVAVCATVAIVSYSS